MAKTFRQYNRNYSASDATTASIDYVGDPTASIEDIGWEAPAGYVFSEWNSSRDGSGTAYQVGETAIAETLYAVWAKIPVPYLVNDTDLTAVADAIRTKGGTTASLVFPGGFVSAISAIETGGGGYTIDDIAERNMMSGAIVGNSASFIASYAFHTCLTLTTASFPSATRIGSFAFYNCHNLTTVSFPACTSMGSNAFYLCSSLTTVNFPACTSMATYAFYNCTSLTTASFPVCTSIGNYAFYNCSHITTPDVPSATAIGNYAFWGCYNLTTVSFPACTTIGSSAFYNCYRLAAVSFSAVKSIESNAFASCRTLTTVSFPACTSIGASAFQSCSSLTTAYFTSTVNLIGNCAFRSCYRLVSLYLMGVSKVPTLSASAFVSTPIGGYSTSAGRYGSVFVPSSLYASFLTATNWKTISARIVGV